MGFLFGSGPKVPQLPVGYPESAANSLLRSGNLAYGLVSDYAPGLIQAGQNRAGTMFDYGTGLLGQSSANYEMPANYYRSILSNDRPTIMQGLAPEIEQINQGYNQALQSSSELNRRGGGNAAMTANLPFSQMSDINRLVFGARPAAAEGLTNIASQQGQLGLGGTGVSRDFLNAATNALTGGTQGLYAASSANKGLLDYNLGLLNAGLQKRQQNIGIGEDVGSGLFGILKLLGVF